MLGEKLVRLNQIKEIDVQLYEKYTDKYNNSPDRKLLLERKVPKLNCLMYTNAFEKGEKILSDLIDILKGLRNAIAHNGILYDCRFKDSSINNLVSNFINIKTGVTDVNFNRIVDYLVLLILICGSLSYTKSELKRIVNYFEYHVESLRKSLSTSTTIKSLERT